MDDHRHDRRCAFSTPGRRKKRGGLELVPPRHGHVRQQEHLATTCYHQRKVVRIICCALQRPPFAASILIIEFSADTVRSRRAKLQDTIEFLQNDACTKNNAKSASSPQSDKDQEAIGAITALSWWRRKENLQQ